MKADSQTGNINPHWVFYHSYLIAPYPVCSLQSAIAPPNITAAPAKNAFCVILGTPAVATLLLGWEADVAAVVAVSFSSPAVTVTGIVLELISAIIPVPVDVAME